MFATKYEFVSRFLSFLACFIAAWTPRGRLGVVGSGFWQRLRAERWGSVGPLCGSSCPSYGAHPCSVNRTRSVLAVGSPLPWLLVLHKRVAVKGFFPVRMGGKKSWAVIHVPCYLSCEESAKECLRRIFKMSGSLSTCRWALALQEECVGKPSAWNCFCGTEMCWQAKKSQPKLYCYVTDWVKCFLLCRNQIVPRFLSEDFPSFIFFVGTLPVGT